MAASDSSANVALVSYEKDLLASVQAIAEHRQDAKSLRRRVWRYAPVLLWSVVIFTASTNEFSEANTSRFIGPLLLWLFPNIGPARLSLAHMLVRKAAHFCEYLVFALLVSRAFLASSHLFLRRFWFHVGLLVTIAYALLDEYHQSFVPSRTASLYDSLIDVVGGLTALAAIAIWKRMKRTPLES